MLNRSAKWIPNKAFDFCCTPLQATCGSMVYVVARACAHLHRAASTWKKNRHIILMRLPSYMQQIYDLRTEFHSCGTRRSRPLMHRTDNECQIYRNALELKLNGKLCISIYFWLDRIYWREIVERLHVEELDPDYLNNFDLFCECTILNARWYAFSPFRSPCDRCKPRNSHNARLTIRNELLAHSRNRINHQLPLLKDNGTTFATRNFSFRRWKRWPDHRFATEEFIYYGNNFHSTHSLSVTSTRNEWATMGATNRNTNTHTHTRTHAPMLKHCIFRGPSERRKKIDKILLHTRSTD